MIELIQLARRINIELQVMSDQMLRLHEDKSFPRLEPKKIACSPKSFEEGIREEVSLFRVGGDGLSSC